MAPSVSGVGAAFMSLDYRFIRIKVGIISIVLYALFQNMSYLAEAIKYVFFNKISDDEITVYENRFKELRRMLPQNAVVGYVTDEELSDEDGYIISPDDIYESKAVWQHYILTQYSLAPVIVANTTENQLVVGNFKDPYIRPSISKMLLLKDFGNGVILFKRELK